MRWQVTALNFVSVAVHYPDLTGKAQVLWSSVQGAIAENLDFYNDTLTLELQPSEANVVNRC